MKLSCAFATSPSSPEQCRIAEDLGYEHAWFYDTPQQGPDVWMALGLAAARTARIGLGPGVLVPTLRHPMVNAAATAALEALAPGRVAVAFGTGFTGRRAMGYGAVPWSFMTAYMDAFRALLRGETVEWEGARMRMLHPDGMPGGPVEVPLIVAAIGPKGGRVAREHGDGLFVTTAIPDDARDFDRVCYLVWAPSWTTASRRTPTACVRPPARAGPSRTTAPTSSAATSTRCPVARSGTPPSSASPRRTATWPCTTGTASP